ncbi:hypothetical protein CASFOL_013600 [Castilleja foliolosa]|uniref:Ubiquitin carboxyl-terminal hydrolase n=1 Tax=Castilleja foliolosa TaxID=1961234 RepID=A0ABD3DKH1_9LAMI
MSRLLRRLTIDKALAHFQSLFVFSLRRIVFKSACLMDYSLFGLSDDDVAVSSFDQSVVPPSFSDPGESIFFVPFRWWKEALCGGGGGFEGMDEIRGVLFDATASCKDSEIFVCMRRGEGVSGGDDDLALVSEWMFFTALKWHHDSSEHVENLLPEEDSAHDLFSLKIKLLYMREASHLGIQISRKVNEVGVFNKACNIFGAKTGSLHIWDFSGQTKHLFVCDTKSSGDTGQPDEEVRIELKIYGLPSTMKDWNNGNMTVEQSWIDVPSSSLSPLMNGTDALGLTGLDNLGNTCFMNSAIQCMVHTPKLADYFLGNFRRDLNIENPLGKNGQLAIAFGDLLRKLWSPGARSVSPSMFKSTIASFAHQYSGCSQHDSQEFLSFLLDGLHEDLNRVKRKPYIESKDEDGRPDEEVADECWKYHLSRNDSIIVDLCQGQYRSTLVCPVCKKLSKKFDPFMYLSLPIPSSTGRRMTLTIFNTDGTTLPSPVTIRVPVKSTSKDLVEALGIACSLRDDETLLITEVHSNEIVKFYDLLDEPLELIGDVDKLVAYRLPKDMDGSRFVVFSHVHEEQLSLEKFGFPLLARVSDFSRGSELRKLFLNVISPFLLAGGKFLNDGASQKSAHEDKFIEDAVSGVAENSNIESENGTDFKFHLDNINYYDPIGPKIEMDEPLPVLMSDEPIEVIVTWPKKMIQNYDPSFESLLPNVSKSTEDSISLYNCVDAFLKEEPLGRDDMWYCPDCKENRQANKKLGLWRLPEILVIHLKRFSYTKHSKDKLETFVDFPIDEFDLSDYVIRENNMVGSRYKLYSVINHYGGMGGGHYTAFVKHRHDTWYRFNDKHVASVTEEQIKTKSAYVLFYKRI